jgi:hypothetical protein
MSNAVNQDGKQINISDSVSINARVTAQSGTGSLAQMVCETAWSPSTYVCQANDSNAADHGNDSTHTALSFNGGKNYGPGDQCTTLGTVVGISGSGVTAALSVVLVSSLTTVTVPAGAVRSDNK